MLSLLSFRLSFFGRTTPANPDSVVNSWSFGQYGAGLEAVNVEYKLNSPPPFFSNFPDSWTLRWYSKSSYFTSSWNLFLSHKKLTNTGHDLYSDTSRIFARNLLTHWSLFYILFFVNFLSWDFGRGGQIICGNCLAKIFLKVYNSDSSRRIFQS